MSRQYHLPLPQHEAMTAEDFMVTASNREAVAWALEREPAAWPHHCFILYGPQGCGKTHLLTIWQAKNNARRIVAGEDVVSGILGTTDPQTKARHSRESGNPAASVREPNESCAAQTRGRLDPRFRGDDTTGLPQVRAFALDDADKISGDATLEEWLQHLYNATQAAGMPLLITARKPPAGWSLGLKDIESRLKSCPAIEIKEPDDELMRGLLVKLFADRQLLVEMDVIDYLVPRIERTGTAVRRVVSVLDEKALEKSHKITIPFVQKVLAA